MRRILRGVLLITILFPATAAHAKVVKMFLSASPADYRGACPAVIQFKGSVTVDGPGTVQYIFERNDGATDTITKILIFPTAGTKPVSTTWTIGGDALPYFTGWEAIKILGATPVLSNQAKFSLRCNPPPNSAIAAHGNIDWHIDTANEFLFGKDMAGSVTAPNHAPDTWTKRHIHVGATSTAKYYHDRTRTPSGDDANLTNGIDTAMLFFYAGHGWPLSWDTLGNSASQPNMALANITGGAGRLRYYWQCSCEVFAHGPKTCAGATFEYACPGNFTGGADSEAQRNVFERWGPVLRPDLRMACGASTSAYCHEGNVNKIWNNFNNLGMTVAESFIDGLSGAGVVPLCITMGGSDITATPLYDTTFTNQPNTSGSSHYHLMYPGGTASRWNLPTMLVRIPKLLPKYRLIAPGPPARFRGMDLRSGRTAVAAFPEFAGGKAEVRHDELSGALYLKSVQRPPGAERPIEQRVYLERARALVRELGWENKELGQPRVTPLLTASVAAEGGRGDVRRGQAGVIVTWQRQIEAGGQRIDVIGDGGLVRVSLSNGGSILHASRVWRELQAPSGSVAIKRFEQARDEAIKKLRNPGAYRLDQWRWGYKEMAGGARQDEMQIVFQFAFVPKEKVKGVPPDPPQMVEVLGELR